MIVVMGWEGVVGGGREARFVGLDFLVLLCFFFLSF